MLMIVQLYSKHMYCTMLPLSCSILVLSSLPILTFLPSYVSNPNPPQTIDFLGEFRLKIQPKTFFKIKEARTHQTFKRPSEENNFLLLPTDEPNYVLNTELPTKLLRRLHIDLLNWGVAE